MAPLAIIADVARRHDVHPNLLHAWRLEARHVSLQSTEAYLRADPAEKLEALGAMSAPLLKPGRFRPPDKLIAMLRDTRRSNNYVE